MFSKGEVELQVQWIGPSEAKLMLAGNIDNRRLRPGVVSRYARDMACGNWKFNGDAIRFNGDGTLLDGQHRLLACIESGTVFKTLVIRGLSHDDRATLDTGAKRSMTDVLRWRGETSQALLAAIISWCLRYETGNFRNPQFGPSHSEQLDWLSENPGVRGSMNVGREVRRQGVPISASILASVHYETSRFDQADADMFMEALGSGAGLDPGSPILALRNWATRVSDRRDKPSTLVFSAVTIKAMNAWREGRTVSSIGWRAGGSQAEKFPTLIGDTSDA